MFSLFFSFFFFNATATTEIYTLSLHDALPIWLRECLLREGTAELIVCGDFNVAPEDEDVYDPRSEEHTSELQSLTNLVCRLLLEKKKKKKNHKAQQKANTQDQQIHL